MLLGKGSRVLNIHTSASGTVKSVLPDNMVLVLFDGDDDEIPMSTEDLKHILSDSQKKKPDFSIQKKNTPPKQNAPRTQHTLLKQRGLQLALNNDSRSDMRLEVSLINDTHYDFLYDIVISKKGETLKKENGIVNHHEVNYLMIMMKSELSDNPQFDIKYRKVTTEGQGDWIKKSIKVRPKILAKKPTLAPLLNQPAYLFLIGNEDKLSKPSNELRNQAKQYGKSTTIKTGNYSMYERPSLQEVANFPTEVDLHIDRLASESSKLKPADIFRLQMTKFEQYLQKAINLGVGRVYIIHGKGKGRLRSEIANRLRGNPSVKSFNNDYHSKYGHGATEVIFV